MLRMLLAVLCIGTNTNTETRSLSEMIREAGNGVKRSAYACNQYCAGCLGTL